MKYNLIVAMDPNGVIGKDGGIPWHFKEDLQFFKRTTKNCHVVMGRKTWFSLPEAFRPLPDRENLVVTNNFWAVYPSPVHIWMDLDRCKAWLDEREGDTYFIGGASIYQWALNNVKFDNMYLTITKKEYDGDVIFPVEDYVAYKFKNIPYTTTSEEFDEYIRYHHTFPRKEDV